MKKKGLMHYAECPSCSAEVEVECDAVSDLENASKAALLALNSCASFFLTKLGEPPSPEMMADAIIQVSAALKKSGAQ